MLFKRRFSLTRVQRLRQFLWPREGWTRAFTYMWYRAVRSKSTSHSVALGLACGGCVSASPFIGFHILYAWLLCLPFRANYFAAAFGTWIGNPLTFPFLWAASYEVGVFIMGQETLPVDFATFTFTAIWQQPGVFFEPIILPTILGSLPVGLAIGTIIYYSSLWLVRTYQKRRASYVRKRK